MTWYNRAADQHLAIAEHFLFRVYSFGLLGVSTDVQKALTLLERAHVDSAGAFKSEIALDLARVYMGPRSEAAAPVPGAPDEVRGLRYLEEAFQLDPKNQSAIDWLLDIYATRGDDARAIKLAERSQNSTMIEKIADRGDGGSRPRYVVLANPVDSHESILYRSIATEIGRPEER
jgi:TPR repeat protein